MSCQAIFSSFLLVFVLLLISCKERTVVNESLNETNKILQKTTFGQTADGKTIDKYLLKNKRGMFVEIITYGGIITSWNAPDKNGDNQNIVLGFDSLTQYERNNPYFGALIGRYGNRIAKGKFSVEGFEYSLDINDGQNHLHGGSTGFDKVVWNVLESGENDSISFLVLSYISPDLEMGYPGTLQTTVTYTLNNQNALSVKYEATTDKPTIVNFTQHSYFNLSGNFSKTILDHELFIDADAYLPVDPTLIPLGTLDPVTNTPFDFTQSKKIGQDINNKNQQLSTGKGYDHCWVLNGSGFRKVCELYHPDSGRLLTISSDEPGLQFYSGNFLDGTLPAYGGGTYAFRSGLCLETQHFPDSPNQPSFPSVILKPGEKYESNTKFQFSVK